ncbi:MAG: MFS transporter [Gammaproteobacteria bacterium]|nr:MFS transporter [Gammaproteobacteria bacterium]
MIHTIRHIWALLLGTAILWFGTGMLYILVVIRAREAGFSTESIGLMQSSYQVGWLIAALLIPFLIRHVGHVRVFAAVAALGSAVILTHLLLIDAYAWIAERMIMGICTAGLMVATESWLNDLSENKARGKTMAIYTILSWGAPVIGIWVLRYGNIYDSTFFLLSSVLLSLGAIPVLVSASRTPSLIAVERFSLTRLYRITPVGVVGTFMAGLCHGGLYASASLYGVAIDLSVAEISTLSVTALIVGVLLQWPIAIVSDRIDRRTLLVITAGLATAPAVYFSLKSALSVTEIYIAVGTMGAFVLGLYSQCIAHVNDHLKPGQIVSAAGVLVLTYGIGYAITPVIIGFLLSQSSRSFFWVNATCTGFLALFVLYRMTRREAVSDQGELIPVSTASPYSTVVSAAEVWSNETRIEEGSEFDKINVVK